MSWNYRLIAHHKSLVIHEVYYNQRGEIESWTEDPVAVWGESVEEVIGCLDKMAEAANKPILEESDGKLSPRSEPPPD